MLFNPTEPPLPEWRHFASRAAAAAFCDAAFPPDLEAIKRPYRNVRWSFPLEESLPKFYPDALDDWGTLYDRVVAMCPKERWGEIEETPRDLEHRPVKGKKRVVGLEPPPIVLACAADVATACLQLYMATLSGVTGMIGLRKEKWQPFAMGYGCIGVYNDQAITYEPPPELDRRLIPAPP